MCIVLLCSSYQAYKQENVLLLGGKQIPNDQFTPVTDQDILSLLSSHVQDNIIQVCLKVCCEPVNHTTMVLTEQ